MIINISPSLYDSFFSKRIYLFFVTFYWIIKNYSLFLDFFSRKKVPWETSIHLKYLKQLCSSSTWVSNQFSFQFKRCLTNLALNFYCLFLFHINSETLLFASWKPRRFPKCDRYASRRVLCTLLSQFQVPVNSVEKLELLLVEKVFFS